MSINRLLHIISGLALVFCGWAAPEEAARSQEIEELRSLVTPYLDAKYIVGLTVGCVRDGQDDLIVGFGQMAADDKRAPDGSTVYEIGSISKVFTGILLAREVIAGELKLEDPVQERLPNGFEIPSWNERKITLLDLTTHASGLPRLPGNMDPAASDPYASYDAAQLKEFMQEHRLQREPGERTEYSNLGFALLGYTLSQQAGVDYEKLLHRTIFDPLEMEHSTTLSSKVDKKLLAAPHSIDLKPNNNWNFRVFSGAGAIRSSTDDMLRFIHANLKPPPDETGEAIELAWKVHREAVKDEFAMGLGWHIARDGSTRWHNGQTGGYSSAIFINRDKQTGIVVLANTASPHVHELAEQIAVWAMGGKVEPRQFEQTIEVDDVVLERHLGQYQLAPGVVLTIERGEEEGQLTAQLSGQSAFQIYPRSENEWFYRIVKATLMFETEGEKPSSSVTLLQNGATLRFNRVLDVPQNEAAETPPDAD